MKNLLILILQFKNCTENFELIYISNLLCKT